jgi:branched-chain amino acid transport system permease protein
VVAIAAGALLATVVAAVIRVGSIHYAAPALPMLTFGMTELIRHAVAVFRKVTGTVGRDADDGHLRPAQCLTVLGLAVLADADLSGGAVRIRFGLAAGGRRRGRQRAQTRRVNAAGSRIAGFAMAAFAGAVGAAMKLRWTYIDPITHRVQPLHRLSNRADRPDRRRRPCGAAGRHWWSACLA